MAKKFRQVNEAFDWIFEPRSKKEQLGRIKEVASANQSIVPFVRWGVGADSPDWGVPEGHPERTKIEDDIPDWEGLINGLSKLGMTDSEVLAICWDVRKGGIGY